MNQFQNFIQLIPLSANEYNPNQAHIRGANLSNMKQNIMIKEKKKEKENNGSAISGAATEMKSWVLGKPIGNAEQVS